ncbi:MAG: CotH kinase family protein [Bacteroidota bacterium]
MKKEHQLKPGLLTIFLFLFIQYNGQLFINEFSAGNYDDHTDNYGEFEDWIEIYNAGGTAVDLNGYHFSDDINETMKWQVNAALMVPPGGYTMVYCSKRDEVAGGVAHTDFKITQTRNEYVVLADNAGNIVDLFWIEIPNQENHSYGRNSDGGPTWEVYTNPTPNAANTGGMAGYALTPTFDQEAGYYPGAINLTITSPSPNTEIRYTLNGFEPTATSTLYTGPINIAATTVVKAAAFSTNGNLLTSHVECNSYFIDGDQHSVYIVSISGDDIFDLLGPAGGPGPEPVINFELFAPGGAFLTESTGDSNEHGNDSNAYDQRGFDYISRDQYGNKNALYHEIFRDKSRDEYQRLILKAAANDNYNFQNGGAHIRDSYVHSLSQVADLRMDERSFESCIVYINGDYWGVYDIREKVDDTDFTDYYYDQPKGFVDYIKTWGGTWYEYDSGTANEWNDLVNFITTNDMTDQANYDYVKSVFNTGSLIDYMILNSYVVSADWLNWNTAWWRGTHPDGDKKKWRYTLWDMDATFGHYVNYTGIPNTGADADPCDPESIGDPGGQGHIPILNALLGNDDFWQDYISRYADMSNSYFSCDFMIQHLDSLVDMIDPEMPRQITRWNTGGDSYAEWQDNVQELRDFILERCQLLNDAMVDCYEIEGPFSVTVEIQPPGAGEVKFNSIDIVNTPWVGEYFGNLDIELEANPFGTNAFDHWELNNHVLTDYFTDTASFTFQMQDTIIAYFVTTTTDVTLKVEPEDAGSIELSSVLYENFPIVTEQAENVDLNIEAFPAGNFWVFDHWEAENNAEFDDILDASTEVMFDSVDCVTAVFNELENYALTIMVDPPAAGTVDFNGTNLVTESYTEQLLANEIYNFEETPGPFHLFSHWQVNNHALTPDEFSSIVSLNLTSNDTIVAVYEEIENYTVTYLVEPREGGNIAVNNVAVPEVPLTETYYSPNLTLYLKANEAEYHDFDHWDLIYNEAIPDNRSPEIMVELSHDDTITAHFTPQQFAFYMPNSFSPNADGFNDVFKPTGFAYEVDDYRMEIFDRWGQVVFSSEDIDQGWDGSGASNESYYASSDVYIYKVQIKSVFEPDLREYYGSVVIIR